MGNGERRGRIRRETVFLSLQYCVCVCVCIWWFWWPKYLSHIYLLFIHGSWLTAARILAISQATRVMGPLLLYWSLVLSSWNLLQQIPFHHNWAYVNFWKAPKAGTLEEEESTDSRVRSFSPTPWFLRRAEGLEIESVTYDQWFDLWRLCSEASIKTWKE